MVQNGEAQDPAAAESAPQATAPLITSRFLFVDVAAQRAKQLRRGALPRLDRSPHTPHKLERIAMEEVRTGLIDYTLPTLEEVQGARRNAG
jgi:DNA-directed RNA polymerase omega subunit